MKIVTGSTGLPHVTSNDDGEFNQGIFGDGLIVLNNGYKLEAEIRDANTITIKDGDLVFQGRHALIEPGTTEDVTIETGTIGTKRNDLIVAHYEIDQGTGYEAITLNTITGTESSTPVDPQYTEGDIRTGSIVAEMPLYRVRLNGINIEGIDRLFTPMPYSLLEQIEQINNDLSDISVEETVLGSSKHGTITIPNITNYDILSISISRSDVGTIVEKLISTSLFKTYGRIMISVYLGDRWITKTVVYVSDTQLTVSSNDTVTYDCNIYGLKIKVANH